MPSQSRLENVNNWIDLGKGIFSITGVIFGTIFTCAVFVISTKFKVAELSANDLNQDKKIEKLEDNKHKNDLKIQSINSRLDNVEKAVNKSTKQSEETQQSIEGLIDVIERKVNNSSD